MYEVQRQRSMLVRIWFVVEGLDPILSVFWWGKLRVSVGHFKSWPRIYSYFILYSSIYQKIAAVKVHCLLDISC